MFRTQFITLQVLLLNTAHDISVQKCIRLHFTLALQLSTIQDTTSVIVDNMHVIKHVTLFNTTVTRNTI